MRVCAFRISDIRLDDQFKPHTNYIPVHHLPQADLIMILGENGEIVKHGSYIELRENAGYLPQVHEVQRTETDEAEKSDELANYPIHTADSIIAPSTDGRRQTTNLAVYNYYFASLGWLRISALLLFLCTEAGISAFRCELLPKFSMHA
jgi:ATP-binding cassette subfamily C (CFTR/MRP) protein 1